MAAPAGVWLAFGFSPEEAAGEPGPGPGPWRLEAGPEGISRVWPAWSYVVVETAPHPALAVVTIALWHGQLGHGLLEPELQPRLVEALAGVPMRAVAAGGWHSASISEAGDLYVWGWNESGQLALPSKALAEERAQDEDMGTGSTEVTPCREQLAAEDAAFISIQAFPALLDLPQDLEVSAVSCGSRHTAVVTRKYGQLGHRNNASSDQARRVEHLVAEGLWVEDVVCGPWTTYVRVREP
ncbi:RCC1 domain containing 1 [Turdus rufiventris]|nr:RCC1 domain containing 1 [Turdus rufiventris]